MVLAMAMAMAMEQLQKDSKIDILIVSSFAERRMKGQYLKLKGGAYYCYCTYVLRISRYLGFPIGDAFRYSDIFVRFKTIRRK